MHSSLLLNVLYAASSLVAVASAAPRPHVRRDVPYALPITNSSVTTYNASLSSGNLSIPTNTSDKVRGVNIGGWLVLEKWMTEDFFAGVGAPDQFSFDSTPGAAEKLKQHWETYFTEADVKQIRDSGLNTLRIPIGFWAYDNAGTPYLQGADVYLDRAIGWARAYGLNVWVDLHGAPGSQNGFDNSGKQGAMLWQQPANLARTIDVLSLMAKKYGSAAYADVVSGLELLNEPASWGGNNQAVTKKFAIDAYTAIKPLVAANPALQIVMHDGFVGPAAWLDVPATLGTAQSRAFALDSHLYQSFVAEDMALTQQQHVAKACGWAQTLAPGTAAMPMYVGEWSPATFVCVNADGSTVGGKDCAGKPGCDQCTTAPMEQWNDKLVGEVRRYVEAQIDTFERSTDGWFMWSWKAPGAWGMQGAMAKGVFPVPVTDRKFAPQCGGA